MRRTVIYDGGTFEITARELLFSVIIVILMLTAGFFIGEKIASAADEKNQEYEQAAKIDGANNFFILIKIILPLVRNIFFTVMLVNFIAFWNDYQVPLMYMPSYPTLAYGMYILANTKENGLSTVPMRMTGAMLLFLPILAVFIIFQNRLLGNLTMGGIKG